MTIHRSFWKGKKVRVMFKKKGKPHLIGKFKESGRDFVIVDEHTVRLKEVRSITIERTKWEDEIEGD